jgi:hypothetical protein
MPTILKKVGALLGTLFVVLSTRAASAAPPSSGAAAPPVKPLELSAPPRDPLTSLPGLGAVDPLTLEGPAFYDAVGRPDLGEAYHRRHVVKTTARIVGGVALGLGAFAYVVAERSQTGNRFSSCGGEDSGCSAPSPNVGSYLLMAAGLTMLVVPSFVADDPVSPTERLALARAANSPRSALRPAAFGVALVPTFGAAGGTLMLSGRY